MVNFFLFNINLFILIGGELLYNIVVVLPDIDMNPPRVYMCSHPETPSPSHPSGSCPCTSPKHLSHAPNLDWRFISHVIIYMFQYHLPHHPSLALSHRAQKAVPTSVSLLLSRIQGCCYHLSKFHIYALV